MGASAHIDGRPVPLRPGDTILAAAARAGIDIPTLCHQTGLPPEGGCRLCLVEIGGGRTEAACHTPAADGMEVVTTGPRLAALRRDILELTLSAHAPGTFRANPAGSELERLATQLGVEAPRAAGARSPEEIDTSHPYLRFDPERCITCRRCLHACEEVQGQFVFGVANRGAEVRLLYGPGERFRDGPCVACGACVDACPTHAIHDRDREADGPAGRITRSTCGYCGVGCQLEIESDEERVLRIRGASDSPVNHGHLCVKGRYAHAYHHSPDRLTSPLVRDGDGWKAIPWEEAIAWLARRLREIRDRHGPRSIGVFTSSRSTNEAAYLAQKLFRTALSSNNVDCCARVCHSSTAMALQRVTGTGAASASYADIERARCIVVAGANPTEAHPVVGARIKQAVARGARLVVIDPRRIELADWSDVHLALRPGTNVPVLNAIAKLLLDEKATDEAYLAERVENRSEFTSFMDRTSVEDAARVSRVPEPAIRAAARVIGESSPVLFVHGLGLSELTQGVASVVALCNLGMLTGSVGRPGAGMLPLRGQNNVQGNADMGGMPDQITGYQKVADAAVREHAASVWGKAPPAEPGWTTTEMLEAAARGELRALWLQGEDAAQSDPNQSAVVAALERLELLVVQDLFHSESARYAHLVLPAAGALEQEGTFTNGERRIQLVRPAVAAPGEARPDWEVFRDVGVALGERWSHSSPAEVMDEIARTAPRLFGGVSYDRLDRDGLQWPCPDPAHPGTETVHAQGFLRGKGRLVPIDFVASPEHDVEGYPYTLVTGRVLDQYNVGTMTRRTPSQELSPADTLDVHPQDAEREGLVDGRRAVIASRWGQIEAPVRVTERVGPGTLFLSFHQPETHTNRLTGPQHDPDSKCPEYKVTAVRVARA